VSKQMPDHHDAELALRVYELRRDVVMRESRAAIMQKFWPKNADDVMAVTKGDHPLNAAFRQIASYWEMVYGMVRHGIVHPGYFLDSNGEGLFLFAKVEPFLAAYREGYSQRGFRNAEWVVKECSEGRELFVGIQARVKKLAAAR